MTTSPDDRTAAGIVVQFEAEHVGWAGLAKEFAVEGAHLPPRDDGQGEFLQRRAQEDSWAAWELAAKDGDGLPAVRGVNFQAQTRGRSFQCQAFRRLSP